MVNSFIVFLDPLPLRTNIRDLMIPMMMDKN